MTVRLRSLSFQCGLGFFALLSTACPIAGKAQRKVGVMGVLMKSCANAENKLMCFSFSSGPVWRDLFNCWIKSWPTSVWEKPIRSSNSLSCLSHLLLQQSPFCTSKSVVSQVWCNVQCSGWALWGVWGGSSSSQNCDWLFVVFQSHLWCYFNAVFFMAEVPGWRTLASWNFFCQRFYTQLLLRICLYM